MYTNNDKDPTGDKSHYNGSYYPLFLDIKELKTCKEAKPEVKSGKAEPLPYEQLEPDQKKGSSQKVYNAKELMELSIQYDCSEFQTIVLILKNAFEGHVFLTFGITSMILFEQGVMRVDPAGDSHCEFSLHFLDHLDLYNDGFKRIWQQLQEMSPHLKEICFDSLLFFLLSSQLYKLPVSSLVSFDINRFRNLNEKRKRFFRYYFEIATIAQKTIAELLVIEHINESYNERFRECILKLSTRESLLFQIKTKLIYANDPMIRTEEELEKKYFSFLITQEIEKDSGNVKLKYAEWEDENDTGEHSSGLKLCIRHLFRAISKNCRETFTVSDDSEQTVYATRFFMESNSIYNEMNFSFMDQFIQYQRLINVLIRVYNTRVSQHLPTEFFDYTTIEQDNIPFIQLNEESVQKLKFTSGEKISDLKENNHTAFKGKHIADDDLAAIHEEYLKMQIRFLDQKIAGVITEIKNIMKQKSIGSGVL